MQHHSVHHAETIHITLIFVSRGMPIAFLRILAARRVLHALIIASGLSLLVFHAARLPWQLERLSRRRNHACSLCDSHPMESRFDSTKFDLSVVWAR